MYTIGVLSLQGAVSEHINQINQLGAKGIQIKHPEQLSEIDGLIIPGGESTAIKKLIDRYGFLTPIREFSKANKPIFGTCAGMVLLAKNLLDSEDSHLMLMDITVKRNAFGRQKESFETSLHVYGLENEIPAVFIRAPIIIEAGEDVEILAKIDNHIVAAKQDHLLVTSFHPELTEDSSLLQLFLEMIATSKKLTV